jgi:hypothetical protein
VLPTSPRVKPTVMGYPGFLKTLTFSNYRKEQKRKKGIARETSPVVVGSNPALDIFMDFGIA